MSRLNFADIKLPYDPIIDVIFRDAQRDPVFKKSLRAMPSPIVVHRHTLHPSDRLLEAWYRFKENQPCLP